VILSVLPSLARDFVDRSCAFIGRDVRFLIVGA
jgi:hypothetical protein